MGWQSALPGSNPLGMPGRIIVEGKNKMLNDDQKTTAVGVKDAVAYIRTLLK
jgi:hypothetical protein